MTDPPRFTIAYEDEHLLVVDKPPASSCTPRAGIARDARAAARGRAPPAARRGGRGSCTASTATPRACSGRRAGRGPPAAAAALAARRDRARVPRARRRPPAGAQRHDRRADRPRPRAIRTRCSIDSDRPREARTHFALEEALPATTLLRVRLETGRTHQIRAHFQAIGHPVCGDREYGTAGRYGLERQFLHAARLEFEQPFSGEPRRGRSPLPADLERALARAPTRAIACTRANLTPNSTRAVPGRALPGIRLSSRAGSAPPARPSNRTTKGAHRGSARNQGAAGGRRPLRPPDAPLEPQDAPLHLR